MRGLTQSTSGYENSSATPDSPWLNKVFELRCSRLAMPVLSLGYLHFPFVSSLRIPWELGEFVIVHELAPNHGRVFKSFMHAYMPDWETRENE